MNDRCNNKTTNRETMKIRVLSFDFDGCLFHRRYIHDEDISKDVILHNKSFFNSIKKENISFGPVIVLIGSARQSKHTDDSNHGAHPLLRGSCFPAIHKISDHLEATLDRFLLADVYADLPSGAAYNRATTETPKKGLVHPQWRFDATKITILYAQMHKIASEHPYSEITFDFYDDKTEILEHLHACFSSDPTLIPANIHLRLHMYNGLKPIPHAKIQGAGLIDTSYRKTIVNLSNLAPVIPGLSSIDLRGIPIRSDMLTERQLIPSVKPQRPSAFDILVATSTKALTSDVISPIRRQTPARTCKVPLSADGAPSSLFFKAHKRKDDIEPSEKTFHENVDSRASPGERRTRQCRASSPA